MANGTPTINVTQLYVSNQKMLYNIMLSNMMLLQQFGVDQELIESQFYEINPVLDLGITSIEMSPEKC